MMCLKSIAKENDSFFVTENGGQMKEAYGIGKIYGVPQINRQEKHFLAHFLKLFGTAYNILKAEQPDVIITTGALMAYPFCVLGKLKGEKVIYIESFARVTGKSLTGRLVYPFADLFLVQWESLKLLYPKAKYVGGIF